MNKLLTCAVMQNTTNAIAETFNAIFSYKGLETSSFNALTNQTNCCNTSKSLVTV